MPDRRGKGCVSRRFQPQFHEYGIREWVVAVRLDERRKAVGISTPTLYNPDFGGMARRSTTSWAACRSGSLSVWFTRSTSVAAAGSLFYGPNLLNQPFGLRPSASAWRRSLVACLQRRDAPEADGGVLQSRRPGSCRRAEGQRPDVARMARELRHLHTAGEPSKANSRKAFSVFGSNSSSTRSGKQPST